MPTTAEAGYPQFQSVTWYGLFAPKGTPSPVTQGIVSALREAVKDAEVQKTIAAAGAEPMVNSPVEFAAQVKAESERLGTLAKRYPWSEHQGGTSLWILRSSLMARINISPTQ
ncbi:MAG: tripartite tricarboxylate transporter substrate-binding protein [Rhodoferax sp.]